VSGSPESNGPAFPHMQRSSIQLASEAIPVLDVEAEPFVSGSFDATLHDAADWQQQ